MMNFNDFKIMHSETLMYYQIVEHDLKMIYAYMHAGDVDENWGAVQERTLGQMVDILKNLDNSNGDPDISHADYNLLKQLSKNRNHWAHNVFTEFVYEDNFLYSEEYERQCTKLTKDHDRLKGVCDKVEKTMIKLCSQTYGR